MGNKQPAFQFYSGDWLTDPQLGMCRPATRGIWIDLLCGMHKLDRSGQITGTPDQLARICRCTTVEFVQAIDELCATCTADVIKRNGQITVMNRRMKRQDDIARKRSDAGRAGMESRWGSEANNKRHNKPDNKTITKTPASSSSSTWVKEKEKLKKEKDGVFDRRLNEFADARKLYPGTKRGLQTEFENFRRKHGDWKDAISLLVPAIRLQIQYRLNATGFVPEWKHFRTWINNRCWEEEPGQPVGQEPAKNVCVVDYAPGYKYGINRKGEKVWLCEDCAKHFGRTGLHNWARLSPTEIEKAVLKGKAASGDNRG